MVIACHHLLNGSYCVMDGLICSSKLYLFIVDDMKEAHKSLCTNMIFENEWSSHESGYTTNLQNKTIYTWFVWSWKILSLSCSVSVLICSFNILNYSRCSSLSFKVCQSHLHRFWKCCLQPWWACVALVRWKSISLLLTSWWQVSEVGWIIWFNMHYSKAWTQIGLYFEIACRIRRLLSCYYPRCFIGFWWELAVLSSPLVSKLDTWFLFF